MSASGRSSRQGSYGAYPDLLLSDVVRWHRPLCFPEPCHHRDPCALDSRLGRTDSVLFNPPPALCHRALSHLQRRAKLAQHCKMGWISKQILARNDFDFWSLRQGEQALSCVSKVVRTCRCTFFEEGHLPRRVSLTRYTQWPRISNRRPGSRELLETVRLIVRHLQHAPPWLSTFQMETSSRTRLWLREGGAG
jgi:hypothetical protein